MKTETTNININVVALILILLAVVSGWEWPVTVFAVVVNVVWTFFVLVFLAFIVLPIKMMEVNQKDAVDKAIDVLGTAAIIMFAIMHDMWYTVSVAGITVILAHILKFKVRRIASES